VPFPDPGQTLEKIRRVDLLDRFVSLTASLSQDLLDGDRLGFLAGKIRPLQAFAIGSVDGPASVPKFSKFFFTFSIFLAIFEAKMHQKLNPGIHTIQAKCMFKKGVKSMLKPGYETCGFSFAIALFSC
jgi:hypothetical protein